MTPVIRGLLLGLVGVAAFSLTLPMSRIAAPELGVGFVTFGRGIVAALLSLVILLATRQPVPSRADLVSLAGSAAGVVFGFPFFSTYAMTLVPASHGAVVIGLLPLTTAVFGALLTGERPSLGFWAASLGGTLVLLAFVLQSGDGAVGVGDLALIAAVLCAAFGYAVGGKLAGRLGGWQVICWSLVVALPLLLVIAPFVIAWPKAGVSTAAWLGFAYVALISQLFGFFAWYRGLALGGIARVAQVQLLQLFLTLAASAVLLGETIDQRMMVYAAAVVAFVAIATRMRIRAAQPVSAQR
jgi:drug/metabolite transporter (DMT)-like permease